MALKIQGFTIKAPSKIVSRDKWRISMEADPILCTKARRAVCRKNGECIEGLGNPNRCVEYEMIVRRKP